MWYCCMALLGSVCQLRVHLYSVLVGVRKLVLIIALPLVCVKADYLPYADLLRYWQMGCYYACRMTYLRAVC